MKYTLASIREKKKKKQKSKKKKIRNTRTMIYSSVTNHKNFYPRRDLNTGKYSIGYNKLKI
jgi:hypothetical protein